jgi:ribonuclease BN (tRNA processing enzyme)
VPHGEWDTAFGYRFETADRTIVISGDTSPGENVIENCHGCDVLMHEVYTVAGFRKSTPQWQAYAVKYHTSTKELAELAAKAKPRLLILYHQMYGRNGASTEQDLMREMRDAYAGRFVSGHDLEVY